LDNLIRTELPPIVVCTTIRMVWLLKLGPPMVMLGPHVAKRCVEPGAPEAGVAQTADVVIATTTDTNSVLVSFLVAFIDSPLVGSDF
jgi:hypothetical protein